MASPSFYGSPLAETLQVYVSQAKTFIKMKHFTWLKSYGFKVSCSLVPQNFKNLKSLGAKIFLEQSSKKKDKMKTYNAEICLAKITTCLCPIFG